MQIRAKQNTCVEIIALHFKHRVSTLKRVKVYIDSISNSVLRLYTVSPSLPLFFTILLTLYAYIDAKVRKLIFTYKEFTPPKNIIYGTFYTFFLKNLLRFAFLEFIHLIFP